MQKLLRMHADISAMMSYTCNVNAPVFVVLLN